MIAYLLAGLIFVANPEIDLGAHLQRLKASMHNEVTYIEEQGSVLLDSPLTSRGVMKYRATDRALIKQVSHPEPAQLTVLDNRLLVESGGRKRQYSLRSRPQMLALLGGFRSLIEGDQAALEEHFAVELIRENDQRWQLMLTPRSQRLAKHLSLVTVSGSGSDVEIIETTLPSGDWQRLRLMGPVNHDLPASEQ